MAIDPGAAVAARAFVDEARAALAELASNPDETAALLQAVEARWNPRDLSSAVAFLTQRLSGEQGEFFLYGAGTHTQALLSHPGFAALRDRVAGCIDRRAAQLASADDSAIPLYSPTRIAHLPDYPIVVAHQELELSIVADLVELGVPPARLIPVYSSRHYAEFCDSTAFDLHIDALANADLPPCWVVVSVMPTAIIPLSAWPTLLPNHRIVHLDLARNGAGDGAGITTLRCQQSLRNLLHAVERLAPDGIYVHDQFTSGNITAMLLKTLFPHTPVFLELYDSLKLFFSDPSIMLEGWHWRREDLAVALAAESAAALTRYDGIISKEEPAAIRRELREARRFLPFQPWLPRAEQRRHVAPPGQRPRLVWAGSILPSSLSKELFGDNQILEVLAALTAQGFDVTLYTGHADYSAFESALPDYARLAAICPDLRFRPALPRPRLIEAMAQEFDYGLLFAGPDWSASRREGMRTTFAAKLLSYLGAGLPVIVSEEFEYMANWVRAQGIGLAPSRSALPGLRTQVDAAPYSEFVENVSALQPQLALERHLPTLRSFLLSNDDIPGEKDR